VLKNKKGNQEPSEGLVPDTEGALALSEREREVLFLAGEGLTDKEIALRLNIAAKTVRTYWDRMRAKFDAASRTEVLAKALQKAFDAVAESEQRLRRFVQHMPVMFTAYDEVRDSLLSNREYARVTGLGQAEPAEGAEEEVPLYPQHPQILQILTEQDEDYRDLEIKIDCTNGPDRTVAWSSTARQFPIPGWRTWAIGIDVTERKLAERALAESEARYRQLLEASTQGVWTVDTQHVTTFANQKLADMFGCAVEDLIGKGVGEFQEHEAHETLVEILANGSRTGSRMIFTHRFRRNDGSVLWASVDVSPLFDNERRLTGHSAVLTDVTHRKRLEQSLQMATDGYAMLLEKVGARGLRLNRDLCCVWANWTPKSRKGKELVGLDWSELRQYLSPFDLWRAEIRASFEHNHPTSFEASDPDDADATVTITLVPEPWGGFGAGTMLALIAKASPGK
jgi:PAS domain S-box-containing protein